MNGRPYFINLTWKNSFSGCYDPEWDKLCAFIINSKWLAKEFCTNGILKDCTVFQSTNNIWYKLKICNQSKYLKTQNLKPNAFHISSSDVAYIGLCMQVTYCWTYKVKSVIPSQLLRTCGLFYTTNKMWLGKNPKLLVWKLLLIWFSLIALPCNSYLPKNQQLSGEACIKAAG